MNKKTNKEEFIGSYKGHSKKLKALWNTSSKQQQDQVDLSLARRILGKGSYV